MATLDDRILGEKLHYYCSSSEDEDEPEQEENQAEDLEGREKLKTIAGPKFIPADQEKEIRSWEGASKNTGPKGVLSDWQKFKQLESEKRQEKEREFIALTKKLSMTCKSHLDDEKDKEKQRKRENEIDEECLIDEAFLQQYITKRMEEMRAHTVPKPTFGKIYNLNSGEEFLDAIDKEEKNVTIVVHIYEKGVLGCKAMSGCMICLAEEYPSVKFCRLQASAAGVSSKFKQMGLPAILVYKSGQLMGNFVRLIDEFGDDFYATDVESFLIEHGMLQDKSLEPSRIRDSSVHNKTATGEDDSDFSD
ncbi:unnamed protein product [Meganyctiphanes norvegica]|uniref:Phosducin domain-containing protein n=1 Tax=Meganyctiphanes norvegica TaxID=48144 RepID=A0AAV2PLT4_MEGNR